MAEEEEVVHGLKLRPGTLRFEVFEALKRAMGTPVPLLGKGVEYAVKKLNEKLIKAGSPLEIVRTKVEKVVYFALQNRSVDS